jgi:hypothetical protein
MRAEGIEPSTSDLKGPRSTTELRPQAGYVITRLVLYRLSYAVTPIMYHVCQASETGCILFTLFIRTNLKDDCWPTCPAVSHTNPAEIGLAC